MAFTGHYLHEQEMGLGIQRGGATMPHLRYQHVPGIDMLTEQNHENLTIKEATSVAHQFGRDWVLSETYGCSSWEFTFEGQKWVGDWQYVQGVNLRCQHLALYSIRGCRKRDYPPAFSYQTTWWKYNPVVEDYFARLGLVGSAGQPVRDVLMLHPIATGWSIVGQSDDSVALANHYSERLNDFARAALATHYDFDFGDEMIMAEVGGVDGGALRVGQATYRVVVIPPDTRTLLASTVDLLDKFLDAGGTVVAVEPTPTMIEGRPDARVAELLARHGVRVIVDRSGLQAALEEHLPRRVSLRTVRPGRRPLPCSPCSAPSRTAATPTCSSTATARVARSSTWPWRGAAGSKSGTRSPERSAPSLLWNATGGFASARRWAPPPRGSTWWTPPASRSCPPQSRCATSGVTAAACSAPTWAPPAPLPGRTPTC